nr:reverse transcriptase domain-containing protein [Tanacetum cinerariifolium]
MQEETKKRSSQSLQARLNFDPEYEASPPRHRKERRERDSRRPPVFTRIGKKVVGDQTANLQYLGTYENNGWHTNDSRRKRRKRVSSSSSDSSNNEDEETGHWKSRNGYRNQEDDDMSRPWRRQKVDAFTRRISDFSEDKRRRMPANIKTYDGTVGNARNWFSKLPHRSIDGFEELWRAFRLNFTQRKKVPQTFDELMKRTRSFIQGEAATADSKKSYSSYKSREQPRRQSNDQSSNCNNSYRNQRGSRENDKYTPLTKTLKEILATEGANFLKPPPMRTLEERHQRKTRQKVSQKFSRESEISFPTLTGDNTVVEPLTIEINAEGHDIHSMYIDGGASVDILYEHYFQRLPPEVKRQIRLLVIVGNEEHSTTTWMTFMVIRSPSPYNGIIGRPGISAIRAVLSTAHRMLKFPVDGGIITIYNTTVPPRECNTVACDATQTQTQHAAKVINLKVAIHPDYPEQEVSIGGRCLTEAGWRCGDFRWTTEAEEVFTQLKQHIATLPTLVAPRPGEELIMYLSATHGAISAVLLTDWNSVQTLVYFVSKALKKTEVNYSAMEKPRTAVKGQILADFIIEKPDTNVAPPRSKVPRSENKKVNALSNIASISFAHLLKQVQVEILKNKPISEMEISTMIEEQNPTWMTLIIEFISKGTLPHKQTDVRRIRRKAQRFELQDGILYQRLFLQLWLQCVGPLQADYVLREIHAGSCSMHSGPRSVVARALRSGYYWPTMHRDARDVIKKCSDCQVHRPIPRQPQQQLTPITSPCLFYKWGIYIASPFPVAAGGLKFLIVAIDYFTKWIEAKAVATIT